MVIEEDFGSPSDWYEGDDDKATVHVVDGSYHVEVKRSSFLFIATSGLQGEWDGVSVEVDASPRDGSREVLVGIGCEAERSRGYYFLINPWNSRYLILEYRTDGTFVDLGGGTDLVRTIRPPGASNRLRAECVHRETDATALRFFVNERPIFAIDVQDGWGAYRGTSVVTGSVGAANVSAVYDDASMRVIDRPTNPRIPRTEALALESEPRICRWSCCIISMGRGRHRSVPNTVPIIRSDMSPASTGSRSTVRTPGGDGRAPMLGPSPRSPWRPKHGRGRSTPVAGASASTACRRQIRPTSTASWSIRTRAGTRSGSWRMTDSRPSSRKDRAPSSASGRTIVHPRRVQLARNRHRSLHVRERMVRRERRGLRWVREVRWGRGDREGDRPGRGRAIRSRPLRSHPSMRGGVWATSTGSPPRSGWKANPRRG